MRDFVHLSKFEKTLLSGAEWTVRAPLWLVLQLNRGIAYLHGGQVSEELLVGGATIVPPNSPITILVSVLGEANLRGCSINVGSLSGVVTSAERMCLEQEAAQECTPFRQVAPAHPLAERVGQCLQDGLALSLPIRLGLMHAFAEWLSPFLEKAATRREAAREPNSKARLMHFLNQMPESEVTELSLGDVAKHLCCCERHASRLFREAFGCSFRKYVSELRLDKACQMLAQGHYKIVDVALESGHSSLALFNYNFKSRFRMTPTQWRQRHLSSEPVRPRQVCGLT